MEFVSKPANFQTLEAFDAIRNGISNFFLFFKLICRIGCAKIETRYFHISGGVSHSAEKFRRSRHGIKFKFDTNTIRYWWAELKHRTVRLRSIASDTRVAYQIKATVHTKVIFAYFIVLTFSEPFFSWDKAKKVIRRSHKPHSQMLTFGYNCFFFVMDSIVFTCVWYLWLEPELHAVFIISKHAFVTRSSYKKKQKYKQTVIGKSFIRSFFPEEISDANDTNQNVIMVVCICVYALRTHTHMLSLVSVCVT